jgi:hypothetical protein
MSLLCPWSQLEQLLHTEQDAQRKSESALYFLEMNSKCPQFWTSVFGKYRTTADGFKDQHCVGGVPTLECEEGPRPEYDSESNSLLLLKYHEICQRLEKAISLIRYLENENEKLYDLLGDKRKEK